MIFENKVGEEFDNISQRIIYPYIITYSDFIPVESNEASEEAQKQMNSFLKEVLFTIYYNPQIIGMSCEKDDCLNGEPAKERPEFYTFIKKLQKKFLNFIDLLYEIGLKGEIADKKLFISNDKISFNKNRISLFSRIGLICEKVNNGICIYNTDYPDLCYGWRLLSDVSEHKKPTEIKKGLFIYKNDVKLMFIRGIYDKSKITFNLLYGDLPQSEGNLVELEEFFINKGYDYVLTGDFNLSKIYRKKQEGLFTIIFDWRSKHQLWYSIKVPGFTALVTEHYDLLSDVLKEFIINRLKTCDGCGYCTQTNKNDRKMLKVKIMYNGEALNKCPLFPWLSWNRLDDNAVYIIKELINFSERIMDIQ